MVGAQRNDVISAPDLGIQVREQIAEILVQAHKNVLNLVAAWAKCVSNIIDRRVADGEKIGSGGFTKIQRVDGFHGKFRQGRVGVGAGGPLFVEGTVRFVAAGFST